MEKENRIKILTNKAYWEEGLELAKYINLSNEDIAEDIVEKILEVTKTIDQEPSKTPLLDGLKKYFRETPREQALKDWEACEEYDKEGHVTVDEFISSGYKAPIFREILEGSSTNTELKVDIVSSIGVARDILPEEEWVELVENIKYLIKG